jgi:hypothetical protein
MYASAKQSGAPGADAAGAAGTPPPQDPPKDDNKGGDDVVDADFTMK